MHHKSIGGCRLCDQEADLMGNLEMDIYLFIVWKHVDHTDVGGVLKSAKPLAKHKPIN